MTVDELSTIDLSDRTPALVWRNAGADGYERRPAMPVALIAEYVGLRVRATFERGVVVTGRLVSISHPDGLAYVIDAGGTTRGVLLYVEALDDVSRRMSGVTH